MFDEERAEIICRDKDLEFANEKLSEEIQKLKEEIVCLKFVLHI